MGYPSAATTSPSLTGEVAIGSHARSSDRILVALEFDPSSAWPDSAAKARTARSSRGCTPTTFATAPSPSSVAPGRRTRMAFREPARHATCAAVRMIRDCGAPVPSKETTTPEPRREDPRNGMLDLMSGASVTVASHARPRSIDDESTSPSATSASVTRLTLAAVSDRHRPILFPRVPLTAAPGHRARLCSSRRIPTADVDARLDAVHRAATADMTPRVATRCARREGPGSPLVPSFREP